MKYIIQQTRNFYGPRTERSLVTSDYRDLTFASAAEAEAYLEQLDAAPYHTSHNESGRPEYKVVTTEV